MTYQINCCLRQLSKDWQSWRIPFEYSSLKGLPSEVVVAQFATTESFGLSTLLQKSKLKQELYLLLITFDFATTRWMMNYMNRLGFNLTNTFTSTLIKTGSLKKVS